MKAEERATLGVAIPQLPALDLKAAIEFYRNKLSFSLIAEYPGFAILKRDSAEIHLWHCEDKDIPKNSSCYIRVANVTTLYKEIESKYITILEPLQVPPWGMKQFSVLDPSGNAIRFGEPAKT